jgi:hypothetical protein
MAANIGVTLLPRRIARRPETETPHFPQCKLHLQRICGTCTFYGGPLRPSPAGADAARNTSPCSKLGEDAHRLADAKHCEFWQRKSAPACPSPGSGQ